jgi:hypothetical protein
LQGAGLHQLHDLLDREVSFGIELVEVFTQPVGQTRALLGHPRQGEVAVDLACVGRGVAVAFTTKSVDRVTGLLGRDSCGL